MAVETRGRVIDVSILWHNEGPWGLDRDCDFPPPRGPAFMEAYYEGGRKHFYFRADGTTPERAALDVLEALVACVRGRTHAR